MRYKKLKSRSRFMGKAASRGVPGEGKEHSALESLKTTSPLCETQVDSAPVNEQQGGSHMKKVAFVCPHLPHPFLLDIWNEMVGQAEVEGAIFTGFSNKQPYDQWCEFNKLEGRKTHLDLKCLEEVEGGQSFLTGLGQALEGYTVAINYGENTLTGYQLSKLKRETNIKFAIWQESPRPPHHSLHSRSPAGLALPSVARERTIRKESLSSCDTVLTHDKEGSTWAYLEGVSALRIRRVVRGVDAKRFEPESNVKKRKTLRQNFGLSQDDFIYFQLGALEIESGAIDSIYAFKNLLQSHTDMVQKAKLLMCGVGSANVEVRQAIVDLGLNDNVFLINPDNPDSFNITGDQLFNLLPVADVVVHNPTCPTNIQSQRGLNMAWDMLSAAASGITVVSNGTGWVGEFAGRFYDVFSMGNIHHQARMMFDAYKNREKLGKIRTRIRQNIVQDFSTAKAVGDLTSLVTTLMNEEQQPQQDTISLELERIEMMLKQESFVEAIDRIWDAFKISGLTPTQRATLFRYIGDSFTKLGDLENGQDNYLRAIELDPFAAKALVGLGSIAIQQGNFNAAVPQFQRALHLAPEESNVSFGLSLSFDGLGETEEAYKWVLKACSLSPNDTAAIFHLVKLTYENNRFEECAQVVKTYLEQNPEDNSMKYTLAGLYWKSQENEKAKQLLRNILKSEPGDTRARELLNEIDGVKLNDVRKQA